MYGRQNQQYGDTVMAKSVNRVSLLGRLGNDPDLRYTGNGIPMCRIRLATNDSYKDSEGNWAERTDWHNLVAWGKLGEICNQYLKKGDQVYFEGHLQSRSFEDANGNTRWITEVKARELVMLSNKASSVEEPVAEESAAA